MIFSSITIWRDKETHVWVKYMIRVVNTMMFNIERRDVSHVFMTNN